MITINEKTNLKLDSLGAIIIENGQLQLVSGIDGIIQAATTRLKLFAGEWFLDLDKGFPYWAAAFVKRPDLPLLKAAIIELLASVPGIDTESNVKRVSFSLDNKERILDITWAANSKFGVIDAISTISIG